jgi:hypothetical protein
VTVGRTEDGEALQRHAKRKLGGRRAYARQILEANKFLTFAPR